MKNILKLTVSEWLLAILVCLAGYFLSGCDGTMDTPFEGTSDAGTADTKLSDTKPTTTDVQPPKTDTTPATGPVSCPVPSPTNPGLPATFASYVRVSSEVKAACEAYKLANPTLTNVTVYQGVSTEIPKTVSTAGINCDDVANDFTGTTGLAWCLWLVDTSGISCGGNATNGISCKVAGMAPMKHRASSVVEKRTLVKSWAGCSTQATFVGWMCTVS